VEKSKGSSATKHLEGMVNAGFLTDQPGPMKLTECKKYPVTEILIVSDAPLVMDKFVGGCRLVRR
jgi:hypothetical protein